MKYKTLIYQFISCGIITYVSCFLQPAYSQDLPLHGFYQNLNEMVQKDHVSPLGIAERQTPAVHAFNLEKTKDKIKIHQDGSVIEVLLNPVGLSYGEGKKLEEIFYSINLYSKMGC
ncbi:MAG: hypothetical protein ACOC3S_03310 [Bacteroidota bacterium]